MKLLFDQNLSFRLCEDVADLFPGSSHVRMMGLAQATDRAIWDHAEANGFTIVTQDADFAEMAVLAETSPKIIWVRLGNQPRIIIANLLRRQANLIAGFETDEAVCLELY